MNDKIESSRKGAKTLSFPVGISFIFFFAILAALCEINRRCSLKRIEYKAAKCLIFDLNLTTGLPSSIKRF
jgi:hypothetical protein